MNIPKKRISWKVLLWIKWRQLLTILLEMWWKCLGRFYYKPDVIFLVYGQERHKRVYWSKRRESKMGLFGLIGVISYRRNGKKLCGLMLASTVSMEEFKTNTYLAVTVTDEVKRRFPKVQAIALAGQLPGWFVRGSGTAPQQPLIGGMRGTCFTVQQAVRWGAVDANSRKRWCVAVAGGAGHTGSEVVRVLSKEYGKVIAYDPNLKDKEVGNIVYTNNPSRLDEAILMVVLTAKGNDVAGLEKHLRHGAVVYDDTHPTMSKPVRELFFNKGSPVFKMTVADGSVNMFPLLPDFGPGDVPGCLLEALVVKLCGPAVLESQEAFDHAAEELGFKARLEFHPKR